jgi:drug/metabolite transporter (DMT)-like permease
MFEGYHTRRISIALAFTAIYVIWGSTYFAIRVAVQTIPPLLMMSLRCAGAGLLLFVWSRWSSPRPRPPVDRRQWRAAFVAGALLFLVCHGSLAWAELRVPSGNAALLSATTPLWLTIMDWRWGSGTRPTWRGAVGLAVGFAGVGVLVAPEWRTLPPGHFAASAAIVGGALAWAAGSVYGRHARLPADVRLATAMPLVAGSVWLAGAGLATGEWRTLAMARVTPASWAALAYLIVCGSIVAFTAYVWLLRVVPASTVGTHAYVNPLVAVALGALVGAERIHLFTVAAAFTTAGGVMLALLDRGARRGGERHGDSHDTGRAHRDGRRSVRREGVARSDTAGIAPRRDRAAGGLAAGPASAQHLGSSRSRGVLEVRGAPPAHGREAAHVCVERQ